jgi:hypothetical protein
MDALIAEDVALEVVESVVNQANDTIYNNYLRKCEVPHACDRAMSDLMNVIEWFSMKEEDGLEKNAVRSSTAAPPPHSPIPP